MHSSSRRPNLNGINFEITQRKIKKASALLLKKIRNNSNLKIIILEKVDIIFDQILSEIERV